VLTTLYLNRCMTSLFQQLAFCVISETQDNYLNYKLQIHPRECCCIKTLLTCAQYHDPGQEPSVKCLESEMKINANYIAMATNNFRYQSDIYMTGNFIPIKNNPG